MNENSRGSISGMVNPLTGQAKFSENVIRRGSSPSGGTVSSTAIPSARSSAVRNAIRQPRLQPLPHHDAVHHHVDVVPVLLVELRRRVQVVELAVHLHPLEAPLQQVLELLAVLALAVAHDRRQQIPTRALRQRHDDIHHLADLLRLDRQPGDRRERRADPREQQPQVVVDLRDRPDRRARIPRGRLLLDRDRRRQPRDMVHVRLLHHVEELPGIGRQALDVPPLPLGVDRVERQARLARPAQPGDHHQPVARNVDVDRLQVVLARAADLDELLLHVPLPPNPPYIASRSADASRNLRTNRDHAQARNAPAPHAPAALLPPRGRIDFPRAAA